MRAEELALELGSRATPVARTAVARRIGVAVAGGAIVALALILALLGPRHDLVGAMRGSAFWMKASYTGALGAVAIAAAARLARPEASPRRLWLLAAPVALLALLGLAELVATPAGDWSALWRGRSWRVCSVNVALLSLPILAGLILAFRRFAPTRLRLTGALAGLAAGGFGATLYGLHCPEASALFVLIWYSLGIAAAAALGALLGPRLLRW